MLSGERSPAFLMNFADSAIALARNFLCQQISTTAGWAASTAAATLRYAGLPLDPDQADSLAQNAVGGLLLCPSDSGPYPSLPGPQFTGGQCAGSRYTVFFTFDVFDANGNLAVTRSESFPNVRGPLGAATLVSEPGNQQVSIPSQDGVTVLSSGTSLNADWRNLRNVSAVVRPGDPNNCGDMDPSIVGQPQQSNLTYDGPDGNPVTEPVTVTVGGPIVEVNGAISFPVNIIGSGNLTVVNFPGNGGPPEFGYPGADPRANRCCPDPSPLINPPDPGDDPPEEDPEGPLVGIWIKSVLPATGMTSTQVGLANGPNAVFPRIGSVTFGVNTGGALAWLNPIDFQVSPCFIPVPDPLLAIDVKVNPLKNVTIETQRIYRKPDLILS